MYLLRDGLNTTTALANVAGIRIQRLAYDVFGTPQVLDPQGHPTTDLPKTNYLFTGREFQPESGLYNYRNRFYHPGVGRFLQPDPIGFQGKDVNWYRYVHNNPVNLIDPYGFFSRGTKDWQSIYRYCISALTQALRELQEQGECPTSLPGQSMEETGETVCEAFADEVESADVVRIPGLGTIIRVRNAQDLLERLQSEHPEWPWDEWEGTFL